MALFFVMASESRRGGGILSGRQVERGWGVGALVAARCWGELFARTKNLPV